MPDQTQIYEFDSLFKLPIEMPLNGVVNNYIVPMFLP